MDSFITKKIFFSLTFISLFYISKTFSGGHTPLTCFDSWYLYTQVKKEAYLFNGLGFLTTDIPQWNGEHTSITGALLEVIEEFTGQATHLPEDIKKLIQENRKTYDTTSSTLTPVNNLPKTISERLLIAFNPKIKGWEIFPLKGPPLHESIIKKLPYNLKILYFIWLHLTKENHSILQIYHLENTDGLCICIDGKEKKFFPAHAEHPLRAIPKYDSRKGEPAPIFYTPLISAQTLKLCLSKMCNDTFRKMTKDFMTVEESNTTELIFDTEEDHECISCFKLGQESGWLCTASDFSITPLYQKHRIIYIEPVDLYEYEDPVLTVRDYIHSTQIGAPEAFFIIPEKIAFQLFTLAATHSKSSLYNPRFHLQHLTGSAPSFTDLSAHIKEKSQPRKLPLSHVDKSAQTLPCHSYTPSVPSLSAPVGQDDIIIFSMNGEDEAKKLRSERDKRLEQMMYQGGYNKVEILGDHNCFYTCIAKGLNEALFLEMHDKAFTALDIRTRLHTFLQDLQGESPTFLVRLVPTLPKPTYTYSKIIHLIWPANNTETKPKLGYENWGGDFLIPAIQLLFNTTIIKHLLLNEYHEENYRDSEVLKYSFTEIEYQAHYIKTKKENMPPSTIHLSVENNNHYVLWVKVPSAFKRGTYPHLDTQSKERISSFPDLGEIQPEIEVGAEVEVVTSTSTIQDDNSAAMKSLTPSHTISMKPSSNRKKTNEESTKSFTCADRIVTSSMLAENEHLSGLLHRYREETQRLEARLRASNVMQRSWEVIARKNQQKVHELLEEKYQTASAIEEAKYLLDENTALKEQYEKEKEARHLAEDSRLSLRRQLRYRDNLLDMHEDDLEMMGMQLTRLLKQRAILKKKLDETHSHPKRKYRVRDRASDSTGYPTHSPHSHYKEQQEIAPTTKISNADNVSATEFTAISDDSVPSDSPAAAQPIETDSTDSPAPLPVNSKCRKRLASNSSELDSTPPKKKRVCKSSKKANKSRIVPKVCTVQPTSKEGKHPQTGLDGLKALGQAESASKKYATKFIKFVFTHNSLSAAVNKLNRHNTKLAMPSFTALEPVAKWGSSHINYLAWTAQFLCPRCQISENLRLNDSKGALVNMLRVLRTDHPHYQTITTIYLRKVLDLVGVSGKRQWQTEWNTSWGRVRSTINAKKEDLAVSLPDILRTHYSQDSWGIDCFRYLLFEDGLEIVNSDYFKRKRLFDRLTSSAIVKTPDLFNETLFDLLAIDKYNLRHFATDHVPCKKKLFSLPSSTSYTFPDTGVTKASLLLWIREYRQNFKDLLFQYVNSHTIYEAFTLIKNPGDNQLIYKQLFAILCATHSNDKALHKSLTRKENKERIVDFLGDWSQLTDYLTNRATLEHIEFADGWVINGEFVPDGEDDTSSSSEEEMEVDQ